MTKSGINTKYFAFISYSHVDEEWGKWLHRGLEQYQVPRRLVGTEGRDGPIPARLFPVFRDREELPSSAALNEQITSALEQSAYLIVICSPNSARSRWVNEEILAFKRMGREHRILTLIVDGEPNASDKDGFDHQTECFPISMRYKLRPDGSLSDERAEPIAADARPQGDGREDAKLKLIAGLLGVGFNELKQREIEAARKRTRIAVAIAGCMAILALGAAFAAFMAVRMRDEALHTLEWAVTESSYFDFDTASSVNVRTQQILAGIYERLMSTGFKGRMLIEGRLGNFCMTENYTQLLAENSPVKDCTFYSDAYSVKISFSMAQTIVDRMMMTGLDPEFISSKGYGISNPRIPYPCNTPIDNACTATAGEWNEIAVLNNGIQLTLIPTGWYSRLLNLREKGLSFFNIYLETHQ